jgi:signal transduction histidine kinase
MEQIIVDFSGHFDGKIKLEKQFDLELPTVLADEIQLSIALRNVIDNALHAMKGAGILGITTRESHKPPREQFIVIEISDTGEGIDSQHILSIFEPYFTTREEGTGFGLTITKKIIEDHVGTIEVNSTPNQGTIVSIRIPAYHKTGEKNTNV